jgi:flagellar basal body-associated protein FliL
LGRRYYGGGCLGGIVGILLLPIFIIIFALILAISSIVTLVSAISNGGIVQYSERAFGDYANSQYQTYFGDYSETYEDNILLVFTTTENADGYYTIAWAGDNISNEINLAFGENAAYGTSLKKNINTKDYKYALDKNLAMVVDDMRKTAKQYESFSVPSEGERAPSKVVNGDATLDFNVKTVQDSLDKFTAETGISIVLIVDNEEDVFGKTFPVGTVVTGVISIGAITFAVIWMVKSMKNKKRESQDRRDGTDYNDPRYWR